MYVCRQYNGEGDEDVVVGSTPPEELEGGGGGRDDGRHNTFPGFITSARM